MRARTFPWVPIGTDVAERAVGRVISEGAGYQIVSARASTDVLLLLRHGSAVTERIVASGDAVAGTISPFEFGAERFLVAAFSEEEAPVRVGDLPSRIGFLNGGQLTRLATSLAKLQAEEPDASWENALYLSGLGQCVAVAINKGEDKHALAIRLLTGGVADKSLSPTDVARINRWVTEVEAKGFLVTLGLGTQIRLPRTVAKTEPFLLKGRPGLAAFFREYVIDYFDRREEYAAMKIRPPNGILLYGPPGTGKTSAVRKLSAYLGWPVNIVDVGSVGSPYIHQTSVTLKRTFEIAAQQAPSILVMEEIDALVGARSMGSHDYKVEEVSELLRQVEAAGERGILVIATTNRIEAIDPAMLRKGRFDHKIEVGLPNEEEIRDALEGLLGERPTVEGLNLGKLTRSLAGHNMADVAWIVDDAARLAVKKGKPAIDDICLYEALKRLV